MSINAMLASPRDIWIDAMIAIICIMPCLYHVMIEFIDTKHQLADIFTKPLSEEQFDFIRRELGMLMCPNT